MSTAHGAGALRAAAADGRTVRAGMLLFVVSEIMLFAAFFAAYFYLRAASAAWPPVPTVARPELGLVAVNTAVLLSSSVTLKLAHRGGTRWRRWLGATVALGTVFLAIQALEFSRNAFSIADGVFGATFYTLTSFHGLHVALGLLALGSVLRRAGRGLVEPADASFAAVSYYWHFVDAVWVVLFTTVYAL